MDQAVELPDLRVLGWAECGEPGGLPVLYLHGAPGSRVEAGPQSAFADDLRASGVRFIGIDRPGYGLSTACPGRRVVDVVPDAASFADRLGLDRFAVVGWSCGGPPALAVAARLAERVTAVGTLAGIAPGVGGIGERWFDDARQDPAGVRVELADLAARMREDPAATFSSLLGPLLNDRDRELTGPPEDNPVLLANLVESARGDYAGYTDDCNAVTADWGFSPSEIPGPVRLHHGTDDRVVPVDHGRALAAAVPGASLTEHRGDGHLSVLTSLVDLCRELTAAGPH